jgi:hypothetical protein
MVSEKPPMCKAEISVCRRRFVRASNHALKRKPVHVLQAANGEWAGCFRGRPTGFVAATVRQTLNGYPRIHLRARLPPSLKLPRDKTARQAAKLVSDSRIHRREIRFWGAQAPCLHRLAPSPNGFLFFSEHAHFIAIKRYQQTLAQRIKQRIL